MSRRNGFYFNSQFSELTENTSTFYDHWELVSELAPAHCETLQDAPGALEALTEPPKVEENAPNEPSVPLSKHKALEKELEKLKEELGLLKDYHANDAQLAEPKDPQLAEQDVERDQHYAPNRQENIPENLGNRGAAEEHAGFLQLYRWLPEDQTMLFRPDIGGKMPQIVTEIKDAEYFYELNKGYLEPLWAELDEEQQGKWKEIQMELEQEQKYQMENQWIRKRAQNRGRKRKNGDGAENKEDSGEKRRKSTRFISRASRN